jgi:solute carrier family 25 phosphate transporter 23/24/25/41
MSGDTVQSLGTTTKSPSTPKAFPTTFIGAIASIASPRFGTGRKQRKSFEPAVLPSPVQPAHMDLDPSKAPWPAKPPDLDMIATDDSLAILDDSVQVKPMLISLMPEPGYFLAGGMSGVISRTATAPLDRLKVYLIAQTGVPDVAIKAAKEGAPAQAVKHASRPLVEATKALWRAGGMQSLFAGESIVGPFGKSC